MKYLLLSALLIFGTATKLVAQEKSAEAPKKEKKDKKVKAPKPVLKFAATTLEKKDVVKGTDRKFTFEFKNTGKVPVIITNVQTSCGCTTAEKPEAPIAPGKKGIIAVEYDTNRMGAFSKTITVTTNVTEPIVLTIMGNVIEPAGAPAGTPAATPVK